MALQVPFKIYLNTASTSVIITDNADVVLKTVARNQISVQTAGSLDRIRLFLNDSDSYLFSDILDEAGGTYGGTRDLAAKALSNLAGFNLGVGPGGSVNSVTASAPLTSSGGANPNIQFSAQPDGNYGLNFVGGVANFVPINGETVGSYKAFATTTIPTNYLWANGAIHLIATYPTLFAVIGNTYGGDGITTFAVPNVIDRFLKGDNGANIGTPNGLNTLLTSQLPIVNASGIIQVSTNDGDITATNGAFFANGVEIVGGTTVNGFVANGSQNPTVNIAGFNVNFGANQPHEHPNIAVRWAICFESVGINGASPTPSFNAVLGVNADSNIRAKFNTVDYATVNDITNATTLQSVTTNGNTTDVGIVATALNKQNTFNGDGVTVFNTGSNETVGLRQDRIFFDFGVGQISLKPNLSTASAIDLTLPPITGTIALLSDILTQLLAGLNIIGGSISASDNILQAFGKLQNQINGVLGGAIYKGVWNANTNTPTLTSSVGTQGFYYVVNVAGTTNIDGVIDWKVGDWVIFNGTTWDKVDNTDAVSSVNGFIGAVNLTKTDIGLSDVDNTSDINKPVSTAQAIADNLRLEKSLNLSDVAIPNTALNNILPLQTGNTNKVLATNGTDTLWVAPAIVTGATQTTNGISGLVPAPVATEQFKVLKGNGLWSVNVDAGINFLNQIAAIGTTTIFTCPQSGLYEIQIIGSVTSPIGNRNVTAQTIAHTESGVVRTKSVGVGVNTNNLSSFSSLSPVFQCDAGTTINYSNTMTNPAGTGSYNVRILITKQN